MQPTLASSKPTPIVLQETAAVAVRMHAFRGLRRVLVLVTADALILLTLRVLLKVIRDDAALGSWAADFLRAIIPRGTVPMAQLFASLVLTLMILGMYGTGDKRRASGRIVLASFVALGPIFWNALWHAFDPAIVVAFLFTGAVVSATLVTERAALDLVVRRVRLLTGSRERTLVVGPAEAARKTVGFGAVNEELGLSVVGFVDASESPAPDALAGICGLVHVIRDQRVDTIILSGELAAEQFSDILDIGTRAGCRMLSVPRNTASGIVVPEMISYRGVPLIQLTNPGLTGQQLALKRAVDLLGSAIGLALLSPLFLVIAVGIKLESRGPVFFRQTRVGAGGRRFKIFKFRSMVATAEAQKAELFDESVYGDPRLFKMKNDPRVTRLGRFLRKSSLDELPQLINVLLGQMSLVGPRPPVPDEVALYEEHHYTRFAMKPGITGPWQVGGRNRVTDFEEVILLEQGYMSEWNILKDVGILLRTIPAVLQMDGAY
ncbi:MAG TPA: sugar transferase [Gemmatimonadaceae bacterium]|nr:sugar transferase [Gemmatimonadaceae bacterium]